MATLKTLRVSKEGYDRAGLPLRLETYQAPKLKAVWRYLAPPRQTLFTLSRPGLGPGLGLIRLLLLNLANRADFLNFSSQAEQDREPFHRPG